MSGKDMPADEFRRAGYEVIDWIAGYLADPRRYPPLPKTSPGDLVSKLPAAGPETAEPIERILGDFRDLIVPHCAPWNHPRFHAFFSVSTSGPGILAEALIATLNMNGMIWKSSPAVTELEQVTLDWLRQWLGLPEPLFGIIHDTASTSTLHAILAARHWAEPATREKGAPRDLVLYTSEQAHSSVEKGALALGVGQENVRKIAVDERFSMRVECLEQALARDQAAGKRPFCVVASVGTTSSAAVDDIDAIAAICERENIWLHVDGAYGGHAGIVPEYAYLLKGVERAHSFVLNPHKWLFTPIDISVLYSRYPETFRAALSLVPEYLRTAPDPRMVNYMDYGIPLGRRFRALKLWFVMRYFGRERIAAMIRNHILMAKELAARIAADERFEVLAPVDLSLICFRLRGSDDDNRRLMDRLNQSGQAFFSHTVLNSRFVIRWAIGNIHTEQADLDAVWNLVKEYAVPVGR